jgi:hypothetical protein
MIQFLFLFLNNLEPPLKTVEIEVEIAPHYERELDKQDERLGGNSFDSRQQLYKLKLPAS